MTSPAYDQARRWADGTPVTGVTAATSESACPPPAFSLDCGRRYSLWVRNVGLACCAVEFVAASMRRHDLGRLAAAPGPGTGAPVNLLVVSGTVTDRMAPSIRRLYDRLPQPRYVLSFGACANTGGPYWDSYAVTKGVDQLLPVDVYVPGCPPRPESLWEGIAGLQTLLDADSAPAVAREVAGLTAPPVPGPPESPR